MKKNKDENIEAFSQESGPFIRKFREKRKFVIECRYTRLFNYTHWPESVAGVLKSVTEWHVWRKYASLRDAEAALATLSKKGHGYEYRMAQTQPSDSDSDK